MSVTKFFTGAFAALAVTAAPIVANAATVFANFQQQNESEQSVRFVTGGPGGTLSTIASDGVAVTFNFMGLLPQSAMFTFDASTNQAAASFGGIIVQGGFGGTFNFTSLGGPTGDILSFEFNNASLVGGANTPGGSVFNVLPGAVNLLNAGVGYDLSAFNSFGFSFSLQGVSPLLNVSGNQLGGFDAAIGGQLSAAIPEPGTWAMMIGGFGLAGFALRRRSALAAA